ncbi:hypothetical protein [Thalassoglobus sp.]|uniref:hypothetical protein n=1 Tax=Thalassoglobus sp. TaxID=2795869 RepID=UPI003AA83016
MIKKLALAIGVLLIAAAAWFRFVSGPPPQEIGTAPQSNEIEVNSVADADLFVETFGQVARNAVQGFSFLGDLTDWY